MVKRYTKFLLSLLLLLVFTVITEATTVKVNYDVGFGNRIAIRGSKSPFSWSSGVNATWTTGNVWTYSWPNSVGDVEIKPLVNDSVWSKGSNYLIKSGASVDIYPFFYSTQGNFDTTQYF
ncbi:MAG: hypothetical protein JNN15_18685, partial [Blastocatellia bacterium]|nr:hypothetical protein [Blastocatellia bacterium]